MRFIATGFDPNHLVQVRQTLDACAIVVDSGPCDAVVAGLAHGLRQFDRAVLGDDLGDSAVILLAHEPPSHPHQRFHGGGLHLIAPPWRDTAIQAALRECVGRSGLVRDRIGTLDVVQQAMAWGVLSLAFPVGTRTRGPVELGDATALGLDGQAIELVRRDHGLVLAMAAVPGTVRLLHRPDGIPLVASCTPDTVARSGDVLVMTSGGQDQEVRKTIRAWATERQRRSVNLAMTLAQNQNLIAMVAEVH